MLVLEYKGSLECYADGSLRLRRSNRPMRIPMACNGLARYMISPKGESML